MNKLLKINENKNNFIQLLWDSNKKYDYNIDFIKNLINIYTKHNDFIDFYKIYIYDYNRN